MTVTRRPGIRRFIAIARATIDHPCHIPRFDIGRDRDALLRDPAWHVQKNVQRQYLTCPSELVPHLFALLTFNIVQSSEDFHAAILVSCSTSALQAAIKAVIIRRPFAVS